MYNRVTLILLMALALAACSLPSFAQRPPATATAALPTAVLAATSDNAPTAAPTTAAPQSTPPASADAPAATHVPTQAPSGEYDDPSHIAAAKLVERDQVALYKAFKGSGDVPSVARTTPLEVQVGDVETFWVSDVATNTNYTITARLRYAGPVMLMYVDTTVDEQVDQTDIDRSAREFEEQIYPRNRALFGEEQAPGIDGDVRLTVLNTPVQGAGGYFSSADGLVKQVNRYSNERDMFVVSLSRNQDGRVIWNNRYGATLAHEFQHMIQANEARSTPSWFNEGMSGLAEDLNGYSNQGTAMIHLTNPDTQLTRWSTTASQTGEHYGTARLFFRYVYEQYAGEDGLAQLIANASPEPLDAFVPVAARTRPAITSFADLYADWAVANAINDPAVDGGRYAYTLLPDLVEPEEAQSGTTESSVNQFGSDYLAISGPAEVAFDGSDAIGLTGAQPAEGRYMWWSKRGDDSLSTLTREFDLTGVNQATLQFSTWYEIELNWDYAYVTVSTDGGKNWTTLAGSTTTSEDPLGTNLGNGITGVSGSPGAETDGDAAGQWVEEQMDLTPFVGNKVLVRFWMVQDASYNAKGLLLDNIRIPEISYRDGAETGGEEWQAEGFVRTTGQLAQQWTLRLIETSNGQTTVAPVAVDAEGRATMTIDDGSSAILMIAGSTPFTTEQATYRFELK